MAKPRILLWDLETTNLDPQMGNILCFAYGWYDMEKRTCPSRLVRITDFPKAHDKNPTNDYGVVKQAKEILESADLWVTWYGTWFDTRYMNSRVHYWKLGYLPQPQDQVRHFDGWWYCKRMLHLQSNRLDNAADFLGLEARKTKLRKQQWKDAAWGHKASLNYVYKHGKADIDVLKEAFEELMPYANNLNYILYRGEMACPRCGQEYVRKEYRGYVPTRAGRKRRVCFFHADGRNHWAVEGTKTAIKQDVAR